MRFGLGRAGAIQAVHEQVVELAPYLGAPVQKERVEEAVKDHVSVASARAVRKGSKASR